MKHWLILASTSPGIIERLSLWIEGLAASPYAILWLVILSFVESSFFPLPPDPLLIALALTAYASSSLSFTLFLALVCTVASVLGGAFGYYIGAKAGRPITKKFVSKERLATVENLLKKFDVWAVGVAGFTPIPYKIFTIASGLLKVKFARFMFASAVSRGGRFFLVAILCYAFGEGIKVFFEEHLAVASILLVVAIIIGFYALKKLGSYFVKSANKETEVEASTPVKDE